jgi:hypothetical protein
MELPQTEFERALNGHQCQFEPSHTTRGHLRQGSKVGCLTCRLWLACIDGAVPELAKYDDIRFVNGGEMQEPLSHLEIRTMTSLVALETFQLNGRLVERPLFRRD